MIKLLKINNHTYRPNVMCDENSRLSCQCYIDVDFAKSINCDSCRILVDRYTPVYIIDGYSFFFDDTI